MNFADIPESILSEKKDGELSLKEKKIAERLVLELYCQYDPSLPFREVIGPEVSEILLYICQLYFYYYFFCRMLIIILS